MRNHATPGRALLAMLVLTAGLAQAQVPVDPLPPVKPATPVTQPPPDIAVPPATPAAPATPAVPATPAISATPAVPATQAQPAMPATPAVPAVPAPPESTPPAAAANQAAEMARGDPTRWYKEDATEEARLRTRRKEIAAAYEEAKIACRSSSAGARSQCLRDARSDYEKDLAAIRTGVNVR